MGHQLLVIESDSTPRDASVGAALGTDAQYRCQAIRWDTMDPEALGHTGAHAIVAVAVPAVPEVSRVFEWLRDHPIHTPTLVVLPPELNGPLVQLSAHVSEDFLLSPIRLPELQQRLRRVLGVVDGDVAEAREHLLQDVGMTQLVGHDPVFLDAIRQVPRFARSESPVLITGETGTGKELCARAIHFLSKRRDYPFVAVDCGTVPDHLVENELFGHARGAYTDAHRDQRGLIAMAEGGTLFLDEIDALSLSAQGKLLRFLQEHTFRPLGSDRVVLADVNVIAATNRDLEACVHNKQFRADLFYRINVLRLHLPPLRDRRADITLLAAHFLREQRGAPGIGARSFAPAALRMLVSYDWPGNVREVCNVVQRAAVACDGAQILPSHLSTAVLAGARQSAAQSFRTARAESVASFERRYVESLLRKHGGNVTHAAREARKDRRAFGRLLKKYSIDR